MMVRLLLILLFFSSFFCMSMDERVTFFLDDGSEVIHGAITNLSGGQDYVVSGGGGRVSYELYKNLVPEERDRGVWINLSSFPQDVSSTNYNSLAWLRGSGDMLKGILFVVSNT